MVNLKLDFCDAKAARYAVMHWHYSKRMPLEPLVKIGVWEDGAFIGVVLFGRGASWNLGNRFGLGATEWCELVRIALRSHVTPVSRIIRIALKLLRDSSPNLRMAISFADPSEGHHGGIYQASGWVYTGESGIAKQYYHMGRWKHNREITYGFGVPGEVGLAELKKLPMRKMPGKHRYAFPLDPALRPMLQAMSRPYPKKIGAGSSEPPGHPPDEGGAAPTPALHLRRGGR